jgi:protein required for attachment to host cells
VVADGARARFYRWSEDARRLVPAGPAGIVSSASRQRSRDLKSDKPGRGHSSSRDGVRHAFEPPHDYHKLEKRRFTASLVRTLDDACQRLEFDRLVLVAPRRSLGELRLLLPQRVQSCIAQEVPRDLTNETAAGVWRRLSRVLAPG